MTPPDPTTTKAEDICPVQEKESGCDSLLSTGDPLAEMVALRARIRGQSKSVAEHIASDPNAKAFMDDWATPEPISS
jgi:hypothetical protein